MTDDDTRRHYIPAAAVDRFVKIADRVEATKGPLTRTL